MGIYVNWKEVLENQIELRKGRLLRAPSKLYAKSRIRILCPKGHKFFSTPERIKIGNWCRQCAWKQLSEEFKPKNALQVLSRIARQRGGALLSKEYINSTSPLLWRCGTGHTWLAKSGNIKTGKWCPVCIGRGKSIQTLQTQAAIRGGECLSKSYRGVLKKYNWRCSMGHKWAASATSILRGSWCPSCSSGLTEKLIRHIFETSFGTSFPKVRPKWLVGTDGERLELDGYNPGLKLAFEVQGEQHYSQKAFFNRTRLTFKRLQQRDKFKREVCRRLGITLVEIPARKSVVDLDAFQENVIRHIRSHGFAIRTIKIEWSPIYPNHQRQFELLKAIAKQKQGTLISKRFISSRTKMRWKCKLGHTWWADPAKVSQGTWCPACGLNKTLNARRHSIEDAKRLAIERKGICTSSKYISGKNHLTWRCNRGHEWRASYTKVRSGTWCPACAGNAPINIREIRRIIVSKGGHLITKKVKNFHSKIRLECAFGHQWSTTPTTIKHAGSWCRKCTIRVNSEKNKDLISTFQELARKRKGRCLSKEYKDSRTPLKFECSKGHVWMGIPQNIKRGSWCQRCSAVTGWNKRRRGGKSL